MRYRGLMNADQLARAAGVTFCLCAVSAAAQGKAAYVVFDAPGAVHHAGEGTVPVGMNASGDVAGFYNDRHAVRSFIRTADGRFTTFSVAKHTWTYAYGISDDGGVAGYFTDTEGLHPRGFFREPDGTIEIFDAPGAGGLLGTNPIIENANGDCAGFYFDSDDAVHGFIRLRDGTLTSFDVEGASSGPRQGTFVTNINDRAGTVGYFDDDNAVTHGFIRKPHGGVTVFDIPDANDVSTSPQCMNDSYAVCGEFFDDGFSYRGFVRDAAGQATVFDAPGAGTGHFQGTIAYSMNAHGTIGGYTIDGGNAYHAFLRTPSGKITVFDAPGAGSGEGTGTFVQQLTDSGDLVGAFLDPKGAFHGFLRLRENTLLTR